MLIDVFDFFFKTVNQIQFKLDGYVPWVGLYQVCSNGHAPVIFGFFMNFLFIFGEILQKSSSKPLGQLLRSCIGTLLGTPRPQVVQ